MYSYTLTDPPAPHLMKAITRNEHHILTASAQALDHIKRWHSPLPDNTALDWQYIYSQATKHRTVPLLQFFLKKHPQFTPPQDVSSSIDSYVHQQTLANIFQTNELLLVLSRFQQEHINAIPFKGPSLSVLLYNQLTLRAFGDLDILIRRQDFYKVKRILMEMDYVPFRHLSARQESEFLKTQMGYEFVRKDKRCVIEIHWSLLNRIHAFEIPEQELWDDSQAIKIQNKYVQRFEDKHLFIYLCAHGTKSFWTRLRWISDIAELISIKSKETDINQWWDSMLKQAEPTMV